MIRDVRFIAGKCDLVFEWRLKMTLHQRVTFGIEDARIISCSVGRLWRPFVIEIGEFLDNGKFRPHRCVEVPAWSVKAVLN